MLLTGTCTVYTNFLVFSHLSSSEMWLQELSSSWDGWPWPQYTWA